ncbi:MAG: MFS transporter [Actinomycetota bacterium]|nr:MFS transporter [Actinomycetota bacterium]
MIASSIVKNSLNWKGIYVVLLVLIVVTLILYIINGKKMGSSMVESEKSVPISEIFKNKYNNILLLLVTISIITYCLSEAVISTWAPTFYRMARLFNVQEAGFIGSTFWGSIIVGRVLVSFLAGRVKNYIIMLSLAAIAVISIIFAVFMQDKIIIYISIFFTGIGFSGLFPLLVSSGNKIFPRGKDLIATILFAAANIGISLAPFLTRIISENNLNWSILISSIFMMTSFLFIVGQSIMAKKRGMDI